MIKNYRHFLLLFLPLLSSCTTIRNEISSAGGSGATRILYIVGGIILLIVAICLVFGLSYALKRWRFLELVKPGLWLARLPVIGPYMSKALGVQRDLRQISSFDKTLKRYGVDSKDLSGSIKNATGSQGSGDINKFLPKEVQQLTNGKKVSAKDFEKKGKGFLSRLLPGDSGSDGLASGAIESAPVMLSESATAATLAYLSDPVELNFQPSVAAAVASVVVSAPVEQNPAGLLEPGKPVLVVSMPQKDDLYLPVTNPTMIIGSDPDCDIHLSEPGVGGRHVQIDQTESGWAVTDLGALGGTYLDSSQLLSNVPEFWTKEYPIKIGPIAIRLVELSRSKYDEMFNRSIVDLEKPGIAIFPTGQKCEAGQTSVWQLHITNQGKSVDHFAVIVSGFLAGWVELEQSQKPLMPGESTMISLAIAPPRAPIATAGEHVGAVRVQAVSAHDRFEVAEFKLDIAPFEEWETELSQHQLKPDSKASLRLRNGGNHESELELMAESESDRFELGLEGITQTTKLAAGAESTVPVLVENVKRPLFGMRRNESFVLSAASAGGDYAIQHPGVFEIKPIVPTWLMSIIGFLLPFVCLIATIAYTFTENRNATATATAEAIALANIALTPTPTMIPTATPKPVIYPTTCRRLKSYLDDLGQGPNPDEGWIDGEYELFANGDKNLPMMIYCHQMASNSPQEYISLTAIEETNNFSRYSYPDGEILAQFEKVRVNPASLTLDTSDRTFATLTDTRTDQEFDPPDYGSAKGCTAQESNLVLGSANIDLTGTQFALPDVEGLYTAQGKNMSEPVIEISGGNQVLDLSINGDCGWLYPYGEISLLLINQN